MKLVNSQLLELSEIAIKASKEAGELIQSFFSKNVEVLKKASGTSEASQVVTKVDLLSQETILNYITPTLERYDLALLTEESEDDGSRLIKDYFWCIDPLDGTLAFIEGKKGYAVSIALVSKEGVPQIGVVYNPSTGNLYYAVIGEGVLKNGEEFFVDKRETNVLNFYSDRSFLKYSKFEQVLDSLSKMTQKRVEVIQEGGAVMNAIWTLEDSSACYFKFPKKEDGGGSLWDYAATVCVYNELGLSPSDVWGRQLQLNKKETTFMNRSGVVFTVDERLYKEVLMLSNDYC